MRAPWSHTAASKPAVCAGPMMHHHFLVSYRTLASCRGSPGAYARLTRLLRTNSSPKRSKRSPTTRHRRVMRCWGGCSLTLLLVHYRGSMPVQGWSCPASRSDGFFSANASTHQLLLGCYACTSCYPCQKLLQGQKVVHMSRCTRTKRLLNTLTRRRRDPKTTSSLLLQRSFQPLGALDGPDDDRARAVNT